MRGNGWKGLLVEGWAFIAVALIAFVGGLLIGDLAASPETETVVATSSNEGEETEAPEAAEGSAQVETGAQIFAGTGCGSCHTFKAANSSGTTGPDLNEFLAPDDDKAGIEEMIVDPNAEIAEGYAANIMPPDYGQILSTQELGQLTDFLVENSPAGGSKPDGPGGEETDAGGPTN
jgi:mono/diheme cytochrome c family protein